MEAMEEDLEVVLEVQKKVSLQEVSNEKINGFNPLT